MLNNTFYTSQMQSVWQVGAPPIGPDVNQNPIYWHSKPDYVSLLSEKFGTDLGDDCPENAPDLLAANGGKDSHQQTQPSRDGQVDSDAEAAADNDQSDCKLLENKARGRHQSQAASLRISKIEKILSSRTDLTKQQRRKLQSRKNTANFRERQKNTNKLKYFINYELDAIVNTVSHFLSLSISVKRTQHAYGHAKRRFTLTYTPCR